MSASNAIRHPASFRDPAGFLFWQEGLLYRQINKGYAAVFDQFNQSGMAGELINKGWLLDYSVVEEKINDDPEAACWIKPELLPFISYPYEWSFEMLRDAALLTLSLAESLPEKGWQLRDASPYNIQWKQGKPIFIDTLSFEPYEETPWVAYRQFCSCFLAPLLIMHYQQRHLPELFRAWPDGIPPEIASGLLPRKSRWSVHTYLHIHLQARYSRRKNTVDNNPVKMPLAKLKRLFLSLRTSIEGLKSPGTATTWANYYEEATQRGSYLGHKQELIKSWMAEMPSISSAADLGANEGLFTQILSTKAKRVIAADIDAECINRLYLQEKSKSGSRIQLLVQDLANPSPGIGVANAEHSSFHERIRVQLILALALIHHLVIERRIPFTTLAKWLSAMSEDLILEWVPASDEKAQQLLNRIQGGKPRYDQELFEQSFSEFFQIHRQNKIDGSDRVLYWMKRK